MFLELKHTKLDAFNVSKEFVLACYQATRLLPADEKFGIISQIRRAALSVHLNLAEGCARKSIMDRRRFYEISRGSIMEVDAALDITIHLGYIRKEQLIHVGELMIRSFQLISKLMK